MEQTLITAWEVVKYSPEADNTPTANVQPHIFQKEQAFARKVLGDDFYQLLIADLVDHGDVNAWDKSATYNTGDVVEYYGLTLKSLQDANTINPCEDTGGTWWAETQKFTTPCFESLWVLYLRRYLAFLIMADALEYTTYPSGARGVSERFDEALGVKSASWQIFAARKQRLLQDAGEILENMKSYMVKQHELWKEDNTTGCDFSKAGFVACDVSPSTFRGQFKRFATRKIT